MIDRYNRQVILKEVGLVGQDRLRRAKVLIVGVGGLGCPVATYLAAAGVGTLGLVDPDMVSLDNLHRQPLYSTEDVGEPKAFVAGRRLREMNPGVEVHIHSVALGPENAQELIRGYDLVCDGTDNFAARYAINDACVVLGKVNVHASVFQFQGQISVFAPGGPCYRCLFPKPPVAGFAPSCAEAGVLGAIVGVMGTLQGAEALKVLLGAGEPLIGRLLLFEGLKSTFDTISVTRDPDCPCCGKNPNLALLDESILACAASKTSMANPLPEITPQELKAELEGANPPFLLDVREPEELAISAFPQSLNIPVGELMERHTELDPGQKIVVVCRSGARSANATSYLIHEGFRDVRNLSTGINGWARDVDAGMVEY